MNSLFFHNLVDIKNIFFKHMVRLMLTISSRLIERFLPKLHSDNQVSTGSNEAFRRQGPSYLNMGFQSVPTQNTHTAFARVAPRVTPQAEEHYAKPR